jgi:hypothetical protein
MKRLRSKLTYSNVMVTVLAFVVLGGGTAFAATQMLPKNSVGSRQLKKGAVTPAKLSKAAKTTLTGPAGATGPKGATGPAGPTGPKGTPDTSDFFTKTESDGRFLAKGATAADSEKLGGLPPGDYVQGTGRMVSGRVVVPVGSSTSLLELGFAHIEAVCKPGAIPVLRLVAELPLENVVYSLTNFGGTTEVETANALGSGSFLEATHTVTSPQSVTWQASYNDGSDQTATAWTTGQDEGGTCVFIGQALTTL